MNKQFLLLTVFIFSGMNFVQAQPQGFGQIHGMGDLPGPGNPGQPNAQPMPQAEQPMFQAAPSNIGFLLEQLHRTNHEVRIMVQRTFAQALRPQQQYTNREQQIDTATIKTSGHFATIPYIFLDYIGDMIRAGALHARDPHLMRLLYMLAAGAKGVNSASSLTTAFAPVMPSLGYKGFRPIWWRALGALNAIDDVTGLVENSKMLANSGNISRLYRGNAKLRKEAKRTANSRLKNRSIAMGIAAAIIGGMRYWNNRHAQQQQVSPILQMLIGTSIYQLFANALLDRQGENSGLEKRLIKQAGAFVKKANKEEQKELDELARLERELAEEKQDSGLDEDAQL